MYNLNWMNKDNKSCNIRNTTENVYMASNYVVHIRILCFPFLIRSAKLRYHIPETVQVQVTISLSLFLFPVRKITYTQSLSVSLAPNE